MRTVRYLDHDIGAFIDRHGEGYALYVEVGYQKMLKTVAIRSQSATSSKHRHTQHPVTSVAPGQQLVSIATTNVRSSGLLSRSIRQFI